MLSRVLASRGFTAIASRQGARFLSTEPQVLFTKGANGVATIQINRPEKHNCLNDVVINSIADACDQVRADKDVRVVVVKALGKSFCAGADLAYFQKSRSQTQEELKQGSMDLSNMLNNLNTLPVPTIGAIQGPAFGGGVGIVSCCDIAVGVDNVTSFVLSEVKLGMIPATISPYVVAAIGGRNSRRYFVTAENFGANEAAKMGLLHHVEPTVADMEAWVKARVQNILNNGPSAVRESKRLVQDVESRPIDQALMEDTADRLLVVRTGAESLEGIDAFLNKRKPNWIVKAE